MREVQHGDDEAFWRAGRSTMAANDHGLGFDPNAHRGCYLYALADHFTSLIKAGVLKRNDPLPAEQRLAVQCGVSLGTARRATEELRQRGLVATLPCKGTFVCCDAAAADCTDSHGQTRK